MSPVQAGAIQIELLGIGSVLNSARLQVPVYQRAFAWQAEQYVDYWEDLLAAFTGRDPEWFLGTVVLTATPGQEAHQVIDGQQRLATTAMLLAAVRDRLAEVGDAADVVPFESQYLFKLDLRTRATSPFLTLSDDDAEFFRRFVLSRDEVPVASSKSSHLRIEETYAFLQGKVRELVPDGDPGSRDRLFDLAAFVETSAVVIKVEVPNESDAFMIFEALNDRGLSLTIAELLKNYIFGLAGNRLNAAKNHWSEMISRLDAVSDQDTLLTFLRHYWISHHGVTRERDLYKSMRKEVKTSAAAVDLAVELDSSSFTYAAFLTSDHEYWRSLGGDTAANVDALLNLGLEQNRPLMLAALECFGADERRRFLRSLVSWSVRGLVVGGIGKGATEKAYVDAALAIRGAEVTTTEELLEHLGETVASDAIFEQRFQTIRPTRAAFARYLLLALEVYQRGDAEPELIPNAQVDSVNLEHILPRKARSEEWPIPEDELKEWSSRLGNLVLLQKSANTQLSNKRFSDKREVLGESKLELTRMAGECADWTTKTIDARQMKLAAMAPFVWPRLSA